VWKESRVVCLTLRTKELHPHIYFCNMKSEVLLLSHQYGNVTIMGYLATQVHFVSRNNNASHAEKQNMKDFVLKMPQL
jgi:hypothetical protein